MSAKSTFALYFGNRGFFPEALIAAAREELTTTLAKLGHRTLLLDADATRFGAVESPAEGAVYARFLKAHAGEFGGVILCLPNFGDETGAVAALQDAGVPILIQAYPDALDQMGFSQRRDAFCGKFSIMDVFTQYGLPFTCWPPHTVHPAGPRFAAQIDQFDRLCRVVAGMRRLVVGALGARTTAFKTVRFDELTLQRHGITTETLDLSAIIRRTLDLDANSEACRAKRARLLAYTCWEGAPERAIVNLTRLSVVIDEIIAEHQLAALGLRCWLELEQQLQVSPCVLMSELNDRGIPAACELDICNAVIMRALNLASGAPATCLDWNNNYGDDDDKCILFHCGPVPQQLMTAKGQVIDHPMFAKALGAGCGFGCNVGRIAPTPMTYASAKTEGGQLSFYLGEGAITADPIAPEFFGCAGVAHIPQLQAKLQAIGYGGYRHHVSVTPGHHALAVSEALTRYLGYRQTPLGA